LLVSFFLLVIASGLIVGSAVKDARSRASSPESTVGSYFAALHDENLDGALLALAPASRERDREFVENGLGNDYRVVGIAVRSASVIDRISGTAVPNEATIFLDVTEAVSGASWQSTPRVLLVEQDGRWYMARAPLAPA
jgi:hypothetical protein